MHCRLVLAELTSKLTVADATISKSSASKLTLDQKDDLLVAMAKEPMFKDYLKSIIAIEEFHRQSLAKSNNYDFNKYKTLPKATSEKEFIHGLKSVGFNDPEEFVLLTKKASKKLQEVYKKYPMFSKSFTNEEKKAFFRKNIDLILDGDEK